MELGKIGDQNVEFFKGHLILFCATKLVQPFKRYGHSKMEKGEKKVNIWKISIFTFKFRLQCIFFIFSTMSGLEGCVGCSPGSLVRFIWARNDGLTGHKLVKSGQIEKMSNGCYVLQRKKNSSPVSCSPWNKDSNDMLDHILSISLPLQMRK